MKKVFTFFIVLYQKFISPIKRYPCCRFTPTCSEYAKQAIEIHGIFYGSFLAIFRILRCNPFCKGGYDPVPEKKTEKQRLE